MIAASARFGSGFVPVLLSLAALLAAPSKDARAEGMRYRFAGTITSASLGALFPGKSVGQHYHGTFTIDPAAELVALENQNTVATWEGAFGVSIDGVSLDADFLRVWSDGPTGIDDGFELPFVAGGQGGYLSLRSSEQLYLFPLIPTSVDLADMDTVASVGASDFSPTPPFEEDRATITFVPEPERAAGLTATMALLACSGYARGRREEA